MKLKSLWLLALTGCLQATALADGIDDFNQGWAGQALAKQRLLDRFAPMADNNIPGTHNSYNSEAYRSCNFSVGCRYLDPQQKHSIRDQLRMGARFIEIDVHWTTKMESLFSWPKRLLMCHGVCSPNDKYLTEGLDEVKAWLNSADSTDQVLILYIEDHMSGRYQEAFNQINTRFGGQIYKSNGCQSIPNTLTKDRVLKAGKRVLLWGDGGCSGNTAWKQTAFTGLGDIGRIWEDRTALGTIKNVIEGGSTKYISADYVTAFYREGANIINLDNMVISDGRLAAAIWSWDIGEPNNVGDEDCAMQWSNGRWNDATCHSYYAYACKHRATGAWQVTAQQGQWQNGGLACAALGDLFDFAVPTNAQSNHALKLAKEAAGVQSVWLNHDDRHQEGMWKVEGR